MYDICIIGGGASGMCAAVTAARQKEFLSICIVEKKESLGKKLGATGNGRCNLSNSSCENSMCSVDFFRSIGIQTKTDTEGRIWPVCECAADIVYAFEKQIEFLGIESVCGCTVEKIESASNGFDIITNTGHIEAKTVLLATGGKAGPQFGCTGDGYAIARQFGHNIGKIIPVLTPLECDGVKGLKGVRCKCKVMLKCNGRIIAQSSGELQFTLDGLSGICIFDLSRYVKINNDTKFKDYAIVVDFVPDMDEKMLKDLLNEKKQIDGFSAEDITLSIINRKISHMITAEIINIEKSANKVSDAEIDYLVKQLKGRVFKVTGAKGWRNAQCTSGGINLDEIYLDTMESKIVQGLFFSGEIINYDGACGGYNLQNAWETAMKAGKAMANVVPR